MATQPSTRSEIFWGKLTAAWTIHTLAVIAPTAIFYFYWDSFLPELAPLTATALLAATAGYLMGFVTYPATAWMLIRPARWWATKLLPLIPAVGVGAISVGFLSQPFHAVGTPFFIITYALLTAWCVVAARQAYQSLARLPHQCDRPTEQPRRSAASFWGLTMLAVVLQWAIALMLILWTVSFFRNSDGTYTSLAATPDGQVVTASYKQTFDPAEGYGVEPVRAYAFPLATDAGSYQNLRRTAGADSKRAIDPAALASLQQVSPVTRRPLTWRPRPFQTIHDNNFINHTTNQTAWYQTVGGEVLVYQPIVDFDSDGTLLSDRLRWADRDNEVFRVRGALAPVYVMSDMDTSIRRRGFMLDQAGLYEVDFIKARIRRLLDKPVDTVLFSAMTSYVDGDRQNVDYQMLTIADGDIAIHDVVSMDSAVAMPDVPASRTKDHIFNMDLPPMRLDQKARTPLPQGWNVWPDASNRYQSTSGFQTDSGRIGLVNQCHGLGHKSLQIDSRGQLHDVLWHVQPSDPAGADDFLPLALLPPVASVPAVAVGALTGSEAAQPPTSLAVLTLGLVIVQAFLAWVATRWVCHRRHLGPTASRRWGWASLLLGWAIPAVIATVYDRLPTMLCNQCDTPCRIDQAECPGCGQTRSPQSRQPIDVFGVAAA